MYDILMDLVSFFNLLVSGETEGSLSYKTDGTSVDVPKQVSWTLSAKDKVISIDLVPSSSDSREVELLMVVI
jgi:hypothetical protein